MRFTREFAFRLKRVIQQFCSPQLARIKRPSQHAYSIPLTCSRGCFAVLGDSPNTRTCGVLRRKQRLLSTQPFLMLCEKMISRKRFKALEALVPKTVNTDDPFLAQLSAASGGMHRN